MHPTAHVNDHVDSGATGLVGDPSGRTKERSPSDVKQVESNVQQFTQGVQRFFRGASDYASQRGLTPIREDISVKSNLEWYENFQILDFFTTSRIHAK